MSKKFWFISEEDELVAIYDDIEITREELFYLKEDNPTGLYKAYGLTKEELENYSDEYEFAHSEGFV